MILLLSMGSIAAEGMAEMNDLKNDSTVVSIDAGLVRGEQVHEVHRFLGIPYAQSIAGKNRFMPPQPVVPWDGIKDTVRFAESSPQQGADPTGATPVSPAFETPEYVESGDNSLALNIWTPEKADGTLPVMVWLHGGGWTSGSGSCYIYDGEHLASRGDVVVVTINHRLGASGFTDFSRIIGGEFTDSSNLGIQDIIAALEWVRDNIASFGGDPDLVTIFGESGGGWKVATMLGVPSAEGLFDHAIMQSGPLTRFLTPDESDALASSMLKELGITKENYEKLNELSAQDIMDAEARVMANSSMASMMSAPGFPTGFWPVVDGDIIPDHVFDGTPAPSSTDVPLLIGTNGTEFTLFMTGDQQAFNLDEAGLQARMNGMFGPDLTGMILSIYTRDFPEYDPSGIWFRIVSDFMMGTLNNEIMDVRSIEGAAPVYSFRFDWQTPIDDGKLYSPHTIEIPFVFNNANTEAGIIMTGGGEDAQKLAETVSSAWVEFAKTGKPVADNLPEWPVYTSQGRESMHLDNESFAAPYMDPKIFNLFRNMLWTMAGLN